MHYFLWIYFNNRPLRRSQWPRGLRRRSAAASLLRSWVRIPPGSWIFVCCECCVLSGRGLCDELITRPEESYRLCCVVVCDLENLKNEEAMTRDGSQWHRKKNKPLHVSRRLAAHNQEDQLCINSNWYIHAICWLAAATASQHIAWIYQLLFILGWPCIIF